MSWGLPFALLAVLAAVPLILYLHSLRRGGPKQPTTALFIWERVLAERSLTTRLGWFLRKNLLLVLQLIAAVLLIAALADPALTRFGRVSGDTVVVVDLSASMKAKGPAGTRFEAARRELYTLIDALPAAGRMMLIGAGVKPRLIVPYTADRERLRLAARELSATDAPGNVRDAVVLGHSFLSKGGHDRVVVVTDGAFAGAQDFGRESGHLRVIEITGGSENVGIVGLGLRRRADAAAGYEVMATVRNFGTRGVRAPLTLALGDVRIASEALDIAPGAQRVVVHPFSGDPAGTLIAQLEIDDDFATDNRAVLTTSAQSTVRLLYVGPGNPALSRLLRVFPRVQLTMLPAWEAEAAQRAASPAEAYDVMVFDGPPAPTLTTGNVILINTVAPNLNLTLHGHTATARVNAALERHPLTAGLNLGDLQVRKALRVTAEGDSQVLAQGVDGPLLVAWERRGLRALYLGFDLAESDLPYRVAFPLLLHSAFEWFRPGRREFPADAVRAGEVMPIYVAPGEQEIEITAPSGRTERRAVTSNPLLFEDTFEAGVYTYRRAGAGDHGERAGRFAVNLLDTTESDIRSRLEPTPPTAANATEHAADAALPLWLFLLVAVIVLLLAEGLLARRTRPGMAPMLLRAGALALLVAACVNPRNFQPVPQALDVIVSVDVSHSVGQEAMDSAPGVIDTATRAAHAKTRTGLMAFARTPEWEFAPRHDAPAAAFSARPDGDASDLQLALQAALSQIGEGRLGRILLISDGNENRGDMASVIPLMRAQGAQVWALPVNLARERNEVFVSSLELPRQVDRAESFEIAGRIESLREAQVRVTLLRAGVPLATRALTLKAGVNEITFRDSLDQHGSHGYELIVEAKDDTLAENNALSGVVQVKGPPRVLVVSSERGGQSHFARALGAQGFSVVQTSPQASPLTIEALSAYELVVLENVPAFQLTHAKMENIAAYVRDLGGGLIVIGGTQAYGAGGYFRTPLERVLPVDMRPPARLDLPHVALLFVIDKSGSMGGGPEGDTKLDLAKAAVVAAADIMNPTDQIGILGFDAAWHWTAPFRPVGRGEWIRDALTTLRADGGTKLYDAMLQARRAILDKQAAIKHVIVLSDGLSEKGDFHSLAADLAKAGVTVSTVSVGSDADVTLLADLARGGNGRGYIAVDPHLVPQIFTAETLLISRDLLIERTFAPGIAQTTGPMRGFNARALPPLRGYVLTYPKPGAQLLMNAGEDPLLVSWRHGLGRVMAFTSDLTGRWGREWVAWHNLPQWSSQLARAIMRRIDEARTRVTFLADGDAVRVVADIAAADGRFLNQLDLNGKLTGPSGKTLEHALTQTAPGRYEGAFTPRERGAHFLTLYAQDGEAQPAAVTTVPYIAAYPREYRELKPNLEALTRLARETGGELLDAQELAAGLNRLYTPAAGKALRGNDGWWALAVLGLLLFLADLVLRSAAPLLHALRARAMRA